jgi:hypothetical protein
MMYSAQALWQTILFAKCLVELILESFAGGTFFLSLFPTYPIILGMGSSIALQVLNIFCWCDRPTWHIHRLR